MDTTPIPLGVLEAKRQLASDQEWLWRVVLSLRQSDDTIERGLRCCRESADLLLQLDHGKH